MLKYVFILFVSSCIFNSDGFHGPSRLVNHYKLRMRKMIRDSQRHPTWYWIVKQELMCATMFDNSGSLQRAQDAVYQVRRKRSLPINTLNPVHSLIYFNQTFYDRMPGGERIFRRVVPNQIKHCMITSRRIGESRCTDQQVRRFVTNYSGMYGTYNLFTNNCHYFSNRLHEYLSTKRCGALGLPGGVMYQTSTPITLENE